MSIELLPCPFCGVHARFVRHSAGMRGTMGFDSWHAVACAGCGATVGACDRRFREREEAAKVWNTRLYGQTLTSDFSASVQGLPHGATDDESASMKPAQQKPP